MYYTSFIRGIFFSQIMGGTKKVTAAKQDKTQGSKDSKDSKKGRKEKGEGGARKAEITVMVNEKEAMKIMLDKYNLFVTDEYGYNLRKKQ